jgi:hypothetical protein
MKRLIIALLVALPLTASADVNVAALEDDTNVVSVKTGAEYGLIVDVGYARDLGRVVVGADVALAGDVNDFRLSSGVLVPIVGSRWRVIGAATASIAGANNDLGRMTTLGADLAVFAGRYTRRSVIAAEVGFDAALTTHVTHDATYRMLVYENAKDGWYAAPGGTLRVGLQGGVTFGRFDVILRAGRMQPGLIPFYATLGVAARF